MRRTLCTSLFSLIAIVSFTGCNNSDSVSFDDIKDDPTPELLTLTERPEDAERSYAMMKNQNWRAFWSDMGRALYIDHPSRLDPHSAAYTSGQPR